MKHESDRTSDNILESEQHNNVVQYVNKPARRKSKIQTKLMIIHWQVTWLVVTEVWSPSYRLVTQLCHYNARHRGRLLSLSSVVLYRPIFVPNFVSFVAWIVKLAHGEKLCTQSLTQLIWCAWNQSFRFGIQYYINNAMIINKQAYINNRNKYAKLLPWRNVSTA